MHTASTPLGETADALRTGEREVRAHLEARFDRLEEVEPAIHAFVEEPDRRERVLETGGDLEAGWERPAERPPLYGIALGVKDIFHVDGLPTRAGSELPPEALAGPAATAVERLRRAGAVVLGKTVTTEFAYFAPGPTRNPHDPAHTPGGSSSGSAAAVAAGEVPLALGTQTVGSVLRPAAFCGILGFKPSYGRIPTHGVIPLAESVDHVGLFTQDLRGLRLAASVTCDGWAAVEPAREPVIGVPEGPYLKQATAAGLESFERAVSALETAGYEVRRVPAFEDIEAINDRHNALVAAEAVLAHQDWYRDYGDRYREGTVELLEQGREVSVGTLAAARAGRTALRDRLTELLADHGLDCWASPAAPGPAPEGIDDTGDPVMNLPWTHAGLPAVSLPAGRVDGLPVGLQVAAPFGADERLLAWCDGLRGALPDV